MKDHNEKNLILSLKSNVAGKQEVIDKLLRGNKELADLLERLTVEYCHYRSLLEKTRQEEVNNADM